MPHPFPRGSRISFAAFVLLLLAPLPLQGQEALDSLRAEVARLMAVVDSLSMEVARLRAAGQDEAADDALARLRAAADEAAAAGAPPDPADQEFIGRQRSLQSLNPEISLNADVLAHVNPDDPDADNFVPREFELSFISALDPFSRAAVYVSRHGVGPEVVPFAGGEDDGHAHEEEGGGSFEVEEGYVEWVSLPGGLGLKLGKFQQQFGTMNRWHSHALPFQSRSLPHLAFLGEESLAQTGASVTWLAPFGGGAAGTYHATVEVTRSENARLWGESTRPTLLSNLSSFWDFGGGADLEISGSWINGSFEEETEFFDRNVYNGEFSFTWAPPERSRHTGLNLRGGWMRLDGLDTHHEDEDHGAGEADHEDGDEEIESASGFWSMAELRLSRSWLMGARFDRTENPLDPEQTQWLVSPTLTWWQSEFVRVRAEYDFTSGLEGADGTGMFVLQVTFAMGPHKHSTY